jgi:hypothetical protein
MSKWKRIITASSLAVLSIIGVISLAIAVYAASMLNIHEIQISRGAFDLTHKTRDFTLAGMKKGIHYDVIMRFYYPKSPDMNFWTFKGKTIEGSNYTADIELTDLDSGKTAKEHLSRTSNKAKAWGTDYFELFLIDFTGRDKQHAKLTILFNSDDSYFNTLEKELRIEERHDYASTPWLLLMRFVFSILSFLSFAFMALIGVIFWRNKRRSKSDIQTSA